MLSPTELIIALLFILALLLMSVVEVAFSTVSRIAVRRLLDNPKAKAAPALNALLESRSEVLMSLDIQIQFLLVAGAVFLFGAFARREIRYVAGMPGTIALMLVLILVFRQLLPRLIAARNPEIVLLRLFPVLTVSSTLMTPLSRPLTAVLNYFHSWEQELEPEKEVETSEEEIQAFIDAGQEEGILERDEGEMIQSIVHFGDKVAREVMTPRTQIAAIDISSSVEKLLQLITVSRHARIPVFRDDLDNIEGIVHERDLLRVWQRGEKLENLRPLVKPVQFIPETKAVDDLLQEMKRNGDQLALVVDEYGGIAGLITMEDLIEQIVGGIHDAEGGGREILEESPGVYVVPGRLELSALNEVLGAPFVEETECTTVGGAVVELFGKLPTVGERIEHQGVAVEVLDADRRRVHRLRIRALATTRVRGAVAPTSN